MQLYFTISATDNEEELPVTSRVGKRCFYMDDFLYSAKNIQDVESLRRNLNSLLQKGGFKLSKWQSNAHEVCGKQFDAAIATALGLEWNLIADELKLCRGFAGKEHSVITHRVVLSIAFSLTDPLGLASLCRTRIQLILRLDWQKAEKSWDEENSQDIVKQYLT